VLAGLQTLLRFDMDKGTLAVITQANDHLTAFT